MPCLCSRRRTQKTGSHCYDWKVEWKPSGCHTNFIRIQYDWSHVVLRWSDDLSNTASVHNIFVRYKRATILRWQDRLELKDSCDGDTLAFYTELFRRIVNQCSVNYNCDRFICWFISRYIRHTSLHTQPIYQVCHCAWLLRIQQQKRVFKLHFRWARIKLQRMRPVEVEHWNGVEMVFWGLWVRRALMPEYIYIYSVMVVSLAFICTNALHVMISQTHISTHRTVRRPMLLSRSLLSDGAAINSQTNAGWFTKAAIATAIGVFLCKLVPFDGENTFHRPQPGSCPDRITRNLLLKSGNVGTKVWTQKTYTAYVSHHARRPGYLVSTHFWSTLSFLI